MESSVLLTFLVVTRRNESCGAVLSAMCSTDSDYDACCLPKVFRILTEIYYPRSLYITEFSKRLRKFVVNLFR